MSKIFYMALIVSLVNIPYLGAQEFEGKKIAIVKLDAKFNDLIYTLLDNRPMSGGDKLGFNIVKLGTHERFRESIIPEFYASIEKTPLNIQALDIFKDKLRYDNVGVPIVSNLKKRIAKKGLSELSEVFIELNYEFSVYGEKDMVKPLGRLLVETFDKTGNSISEISVEIEFKEEIKKVAFKVEGKDFDKTKVDHVDVMINYFLPLIRQLHEKLNDELGYSSPITNHSDNTSIEESGKSMTSNAHSSEKSVQTDFYSLAKALDNPDNVIKLHLDKGSLTTLPQEAAKFKNLKILVIADNELESIPEIIRKFKRLENLTLPGNKIKRIPEWINEMKALMALNLDYNPLETSDFDISGLENLISLNLLNCNLSDFPKTILELNNLKDLHIDLNDMGSVPDKFEELGALIQLELGCGSNTGNSNCNEIPIQISKLKKLNVLDLVNMNYTAVPNEIILMPNLGILKLHSEIPVKLQNEYKNLGKTKKTKPLFVQIQEKKS